MKRLLTGLLCAALLLTAGCGAASDTAGEDGYALYFREADLEASASGDALRAETVALEKASGTEALATALMVALLSGPADETLKNPIPAGTQLLSLHVEHGRALVDLSASYGGLSGVGLTLADYAITLTLTQLPEILSVKITVRGQELAYRDKQVFYARDVLLTPKGDVVGTVTAALYFLDAEGNLTPEVLELELYEGDTQVGAVSRALENGPEAKELSAVLPEGFRVRSVWQEEDICYVNLSSAQLEDLPQDAEVSTAIDALRRSLCSLETVSEVRFLVDGEYTDTYGAINIADPYAE